MPANGMPAAAGARWAMRYVIKILLGVVMALMLSGMLCSAADAHGHAHVRGTVHIGGYIGPYYSPYYWNEPWYDPWYDPWYPGGRWYYAPSNYGWLWTQVEPNTAEILVDGKSFGQVKAFDGPVNHLRLPVGKHAAEFRLPGYETYRTEFYIYPGDTTSVNYDLLPHPAGAVEGGGETRGGNEASYGTLLMEVSPGGADIYVDGEYRATSTNEEAEIVISAQPGRREVRISKEGYIDYTTEAMLKPGERVRVSVQLKKR
jgi:PEGA domain